MNNFGGLNRNLHITKFKRAAELSKNDGNAVVKREEVNGTVLG